MNKWIGTIRLTKDAEVRYTADQKAVASFSGACDRRFKREGQPDADFFNFVAFGKTAETISKYTKKGTKILVEGELSNNNYEKDGVKHYGQQIIVNAFDFCESKGATTDSSNNDLADFTSIPDNIPDEELPFA